MTVQEFSNEFDILYNNIMSNQAPGLNEYEKSVFLTLALESIIILLYSSLESIESTEAVRSYVNSLVKLEIINTLTSTSTGLPGTKYTCELPNDLWFIVYEGVKQNNKEVLVVPITHDLYYKIYNNPFRGPSENRVLRITTLGNPNNVYPMNAELISGPNDKLSDYRIRYITKPDPIILEDLSTYNVSINGETKVLTCKLPEVLHKLILSNAVLLAKDAWKN